MPDFNMIYNDMAWKYDLLVSREDYQNNLLKSIREIISLDGLSVADLGAGTGRISFLLAPYVKQIHAFDLTPGMVKEAKIKQKKGKSDNITFQIGDHRDIPLPDHSVDLVIAGWSFAMMKAWNQDNWETAVKKAFLEIYRVLKNDGFVIIIETLGTMKSEPEENEYFKPLFDYFEIKEGLKRKSIRTDYEFDSIAEAVDLITFFFGDEMGAAAKNLNSNKVPECTGLWYKQNPKSIEYGYNLKNHLK